MPNTTPSDLDREAMTKAALAFQIAHQDTCYPTASAVERVIAAERIVHAYLDHLPRASGAPEAEAVAWRWKPKTAPIWDYGAEPLKVQFPENWDIEPLYASPPPVAAPSGEAVASKLGKWMSAALDDPNVCAEMKADIEAWFKSGEPSPPSPHRERTQGRGERGKAMTDHKEIWLQPWCAECDKHSYEGRQWCNSDQWGDCEYCPAKATRYVMAEPRKLKISYLVAGEEGVVATGFKSEEDAKIYADALNAGKFPKMPAKDKP